jgi:GGDEF domain-containing protein
LKDARAQHCLDAPTGLFTSHGLEQVAYQLRARAARDGESLTCLTIAPERTDGDGGAGHALSEGDRHFADVANVCRLHSRKSDFIGRAAAARVAILAPDTDALGARALVARLQHGLDEASRSGAMNGKFRLRAGYCSIADAADAKLAPADLFGRAATALERLQATGSPDSVMGFEEMLNA